MPPDTPPLTRAVVLRGLGLALAIALGALGVWLIATGTGDTPKRIQLGVLASFWGLLVGAFAVFGSRRPHGAEMVAPPPARPGGAVELRSAAAGLERFDEAALRREHEQRLERLVRHEIQAAFSGEVTSLRAEIADLRGELLEKVGGQLPLERIETTRAIGSDLEALQHEVRELKRMAREADEFGLGRPRLAETTGTLRPIVEPARVRPVSRQIAEVEADVQPARQSRDIGPELRAVPPLRVEPQFRSALRSESSDDPFRAEPSYRPQPDRPAFQPQGDQPAYQPQGDRPAYQPQGDRPAYQAQPDWPAYQPQADRPAYQPQADRPAYQPQADRPAYQPQADRPAYQPQPGQRAEPVYASELPARPEPPVPVEETAPIPPTSPEAKPTSAPAPPARMPAAPASPITSPPSPPAFRPPAPPPAPAPTPPAAAPTPPAAAAAPLPPAPAATPPPPAPAAAASTGATSSPSAGPASPSPSVSPSPAPPPSAPAPAPAAAPPAPPPSADPFAGLPRIRPFTDFELDPIEEEPRYTGRRRLSEEAAESGRHARPAPVEPSGRRRAPEDDGSGLLARLIARENSRR